MVFENKDQSEELGMNTAHDRESVCNIQMSWKECFKFWASLAIVAISVFIIGILVYGIFCLEFV